MSLLLAVAMLAAQSTAPNEAGGQWVEIERTDSHVINLDETSIERTGNLSRVWIRADYPQVSAETGDKRTFFQMQVDCSGRTIALIRYRGYDESGNRTGESAISSPQPNQIAPDTAGAHLFERVCR